MTSRFALTSQRYIMVEAVAQKLPHAQRHFFLVALARKLSRNTQTTREDAVSDALLAKLITDAED